MVATVLLSIIVHGVSAPSLVARYARYVKTLDQGLPRAQVNIMVCGIFVVLILA